MLFDTNNVSNAFITLIVGYCIYISFFAFLFYEDNESRYVDPVTKRRTPRICGECNKIILDIYRLQSQFRSNKVV